MSHPDTPPETRRRALPYILVGIASIILFVSVFAVWVKRQALETDTWVETSSELLQDEEIQSALSTFLVTQLYANVDVQAELAAQLPPQVAPLAGPISGGLRQLAGDVADRVLAQPKVQDLWEEANRLAHEQFLKIIDDEGEAISTGGGVVTLQLGTILATVTAELGLPDDLASKLPPEAAELEIMRSDELAAAQTGVKLLRTVGWFLVGLTVILYVAAIYLAAGRRRQILRAMGISLAAVGVLTYLVHRIAGDAVTTALSEAASSDAAVLSTWTIGTSQLTEIAGALILYGVFIVIAAWLAGPTAFATSIRSSIAPWFRQKRFAYGILALLLVLLFWWDPTEGTHRLAPSLLLIILLASGVEVLRRQVIREFPERVTGQSSEGVALAIAARMREARERRISQSGGAATAPATTGDQRLVELERLGDLRDSNVLSADEFEAEKSRILTAAPK